MFVKLAPGVSVSAGKHAIQGVLAAYPNVTLMDQTQYKAQQEQHVNQMLNLVYGLLALAVVIALIGIANTLALSNYERTRELGLLRAVGTTRGQLRSMVRSESLVISLLGAVQGLVLGGAVRLGDRRRAALTGHHPTWCSPSCSCSFWRGWPGWQASRPPSRRAGAPPGSTSCRP